MANSGRVEINSSVMDSLRSVHGVIYMIFYGRIRIPRISGNFGACADMCTRFSFPPTKESLGSRLGSMLSIQSDCATALT